MDGSEEAGRPLRRHALATSACYLVLLASFGLGFGVASSGGFASSPERAAEARERLRRNLEDPDRGGQFRAILVTNVQATVSLMALGILTAGLMSLFQMAQFGLVTGLQAGALHASGISGQFLASYHLTHGALEMLAFAMAGAVGVEAGVFFLRYLRRGPLARPGDLVGLAYLAATALALLPVAALIEVYLTPPFSLPYLNQP